MKKTVKSSLAVLMSVIMIFGSVAVGGQGISELFDALTVKSEAANLIYSGNCGSWHNTGIEQGYYDDNVRWYVYNDGLLYITGTGLMNTGTFLSPWEMYYTDSSGNSYQLSDIVRRVEVSGGVTNVGSRAFNHCPYITDATIGSSVTVIASEAFENCKMLKSITMSDNITSIGDKAFYSCESLTSINIPDSVTSIGKYAFDGCSSLTSINIPDSVTSIGKYAFGYCDSLASVTIPNSVTTIGESAFYGCENLTDIYYNGTEAQWNEIEIGDDAIPGGAQVHFITDSDTQLLIDTNSPLGFGYIFYGYIKYTLYDDGLLIIAPYEPEVLTGMEIPPQLYDQYTIAWDNKQVKNIIIADEFEEVPGCIFMGSTNLESVTLSADVKAILGDYAFSGCDNLTDIYYNGTEAQWNEIKIGSYAIPAGVTIHYNSDDNDEITWSFDNGTLTISGAGKMPDYDYGEAPWYDYADEITTVVISDGVTSIGSCAFLECFSLENVTIGNAVKTIGELAFECCYSLTSITIPDSVTSIGDWTFDRCKSLTSITIPANVKEIQTYAFTNCNGLTSMIVDSENTVYDSRENCNAIIETATNTLIAGCKNTVIPSTVEVIGFAAFCDADTLTNITIPNSVTEIDKYAFGWCDSLANVTIPDSVTSIGDYAFYYCNKLTDIYYNGTEAQWNRITIGENAIPTGVTIHYVEADEQNLVDSGECGAQGDNVIWKLYDDGTLEISGTGDMANYDIIPPWSEFNEQITNIVIENGVTSIGENSFYNCSKVKDIFIPDGVTSIGDFAFSDCSGLSNIVISDSVTSIGNYAFYACESLTGITIPDRITSIGRFAFWSCTSLTCITVPDSVTSISEGVFSDCSSLTSIVVDSENTIYDSRENCNAIIETATNTLIAGCKNTVIPDSITSIGNCAFSGCESLKSIIIPNGVTSIGDGVFKNCNKLTDIYYDGTEAQWNGIKIGENAIPAGVTIHYVEADERNLVDSGECGAQGDNVIWKLYDDGTLEICGTGDMANYLAESVPFAEYLEDITALVVSDGVTGIGDFAFSFCDSLTSVAISADVKSIGIDAFIWCPNISSITVDKDNTVYDSRENCNAIIETATNTLIAGCKDTVIPNTVMVIGSDAFFSCDGLTDISIPDSVKEIGAAAFNGCDNLTKVTVGSGVITIGTNAFANSDVINNKEKEQDISREK